MEHNHISLLFIFNSGTNLITRCRAIQGLTRENLEAVPGWTLQDPDGMFEAHF
jgi:hypothetical protein